MRALGNLFRRFFAMLIPNGGDNAWDYYKRARNLATVTVDSE